MADAWLCCLLRVGDKAAGWDGVAAGEIGQVLKKMQQAVSGGISKGHCREASHASAFLDKMQMRKQASRTLGFQFMLPPDYGAWGETPSPVLAFSNS